MIELPTVEECREFLDKINHGRALIDLPPLDVLDFDGAEPEHTGNCLSARHLFAPAGYDVLPDTIEAHDHLSDRRVRAILDSGQIPAEITAVTAPFDQIKHGPVDRDALRARMVEAGVVAP